MPENNEKTPEEAMMGRNREALIRELGLSLTSTDADITRGLNQRNRRQMKIQFGLVDRELADKGLSRDTATVEQLEQAMAAVTDDELNAVLKVERDRTEEIIKEEIMKVERRRGHVHG